MKTNSEGFGCLAWVILLAGLCVTPFQPLVGGACFVIFGVMLAKSFDRPSPPPD